LTELGVERAYLPDENRVSQRRVVQQRHAPRWARLEAALGAAYGAVCLPGDVGVLVRSGRLRPPDDARLIRERLMPVEDHVSGLDV
jgi:hypothetical protein